MIGRHGRAAGAAGTLAVLGLCIASAFESASADGGTPTLDPIAKEIPAAERERLLTALDRAMSALPVPSPPFGASPDDSTREADRRSYWDPSSKRWTAPGRATFERVFLPPEPGSDREAVPPALEYRVYLNHEPELPPDLASEGGSPRQFPLPGTVAVEVTLIGAGGGGGRMAVPLSPEDAAMAPTIIRIYIGSREMESAVRLLLGGGRHAGSIFPTVERAGGVLSIVVDFYGPRRTVESLAPALDVAALRKLLSEPAGK